MSDIPALGANVPKRYVYGTGPTDAKITIVGEAPGDTEERMGVPFVGQAGRLLNDELSNVGIVRQLCYVTNVVKERPPGNRIEHFITFTKKGVIETEAFSRYKRMLKDELATVPSNVIIAAGKVALYALTGKADIMNQRGSPLESTLLPGRKVIPIIHPAAALRQYILKYYIRLDLKKAKRLSATPDLVEDARNYILRPTTADCWRYLDSISDARPVGFDIETSHGQVSCISFSTDENSAISIPFYEGNDPYFSIQDEGKVWRRIANILEDDQITKVAHNSVFDASFLLKKFGIRTNNLHDTMVMQAILYPDFPKSLAFVTSVYTDIPYYKDEGKAHIFGRTRSDLQFWLYSAKDSVVLSIAAPKLMRELERQGNAETYEMQRRLIPPLLFIGHRGIKMDAAVLKEESIKAQERMAVLKSAIHRLAGYPLNPLSPTQLKKYFYVEHKVKPYISKGKPSTDGDALVRLKTNKNADVSMMAGMIMEYRGLAKADGTYFQAKLDTEDYLRSSMNPVGTRFGRVSSRQTIDKEGANLQNQPISMKRAMRPDEGCVMYDIDLSQAENRVVAYIANDERMIETFEEGRDLHRLTASLLFRKPYEEVSDDKGSAKLGDGTKSERFWGKRSNHGLNYGMRERLASIKWEIVEAEARFIIDRYHQSYPSIRQWHRQLEYQLKGTRTLENLFGRKYTFWDRLEAQTLLKAYAFIPQSTVADIINHRGVIPFYEDQKTYGKGRLVLQVHDSITFQIPLDVPWEEHARMLLALRQSLEQPLVYKDRKFVIPAEAAIRPHNLLDGATIAVPHPVFPETQIWNPDWNDATTLGLVLAELYESQTSQDREAEG